MKIHSRKVAKMREESLRLNREHSKALEEYLLHLETYDVTDALQQHGFWVERWSQANIETVNFKR